MITKGDKILIFSIFILAISIFISFQVYGFSGDRIFAIIEVDGKIYQRVSLGENGPKLEIKVLENTVEIDRNRVRMSYADCPDKDCVRQGWISRPGQMIVCLPNRLIIKIESDKLLQEEDVDAVSF